MSKWFSQEFECTDPACGYSSIQLILRVNKNKPGVCEKCNGPADYRIGAPTPLRASYHDGVRRKGFQDGVESFNLESQSYEMAPQDRGEINKEIQKLREAKK